MADTMIPILMVKMLAIVLDEIHWASGSGPETGGMGTVCVLWSKPKPVNFLPREPARTYSSPDHKVGHAFHLLMKPTSTFNTQFLCLSVRITKIQDQELDS